MQKNKKFLLILWIMIAFFAVAYSVLAIIHHIHFLSGGFDLGIFDQSLWQYAHFLFPYNTVKGKMILGDHLNLTFPLVAPLFWLWDDVKMLLIFQAVWISLSGFPMYHYIVKRGLGNIHALILTFLYLLFYGMQYINYFDFHTVALGVGLLAWVLYFWEEEKWKWFGVTTLLLLLTQENMGLALFALCLLWIFQKKKIKLVVILAAISLIYTVIAFYVIHLLSQGHLQYVPHFPKTIPDVIAQLFDTQDKRDVWFFSFGWFSFLPIFSPGAFIAVLSDLSQYFITGKDYDHMWTPYFHHRAILSVYLVVGAVDVLLFLKKRINILFITIPMLLFALFLQFHYHFALNKLVKHEYFAKESWMDDNETMFKHIPATASVATQQSLVPHLTHRNAIYLVYPRKHPYWWLDFDGKPTLLVVDTHENEWLTMTLESIDNFRQALTNMQQAGVIHLIYQKGQSKIYTINYQALEQYLP